MQTDMQQSDEGENRLYRTRSIYSGTSQSEDSSINKFIQNQKNLYIQSKRKVNPRRTQQNRRRTEMTRIIQKWIVFSEDLVTGNIKREEINCRSVAWIVFKHDSDKITTICKICGQVRKARSGNTTLLLNHLQKQHIEIKQTIQRKMRKKLEYPQNVISLCKYHKIKIVGDKIQIEEDLQAKKEMSANIDAINKKMVKQIMDQNESSEESELMFEGKSRKRRKNHVLEVIKPEKFSKNIQREKNDTVHEINFLGSQSATQKEHYPFKQIGYVQDKDIGEMGFYKMHEENFSQDQRFQQNQDIAPVSYKVRPKTKPLDPQGTVHSKKTQKFPAQISQEEAIMKSVLQGLPIQTHHQTDNKTSNHFLLSSNRHFTQELPQELYGSHELTPYQISEQVGHDRETLQQMRNNINLEITEMYEKGNLVGFMFITKAMKSNFRKFSDFISYWYLPRPTLLSHIDSIVYICGQDENIYPILFGVSIIFKQSQQNFQTIFRVFSQKYKRQNKKQPKTTLICGPLFLERYLRQYIKKSQKDRVKEKGLLNFLRENSRSQFIYLKEEVLNGKSQNQRAFILGRTLILDVLKNVKRESSFIGFGLANIYVERLVNLTPMSFGTQSNLTTLLQKISKLSQEDYKYDHIISLPKKLQIISLSQIQQIIRNKKQVIECQSVVSSQIFQKICYAYIFSQLSLHVNNSEGIVKRTCNFVEVYEINRSSHPNFPEKLYPLRLVNNVWECVCNLKKLTEIPCPHLIKVLTFMNRPLISYIGQRWKVDKKKKGKSAISEFFLNQMHQQIQEIMPLKFQHQLEQKHIESELLGIMKEQQFMPIFWA